MTIRLKRLELHGFKSFASPTTFVFDSGITAVIGPNGSGKSNIADALRWVLGEQSYSNLRGRRTEDVIFAGGGKRAPLGMAEVALTLDNEDQFFPLAFSEITITRRAFRSGENHYLINGSRVRLKDVAQVTASLGQAYTVIGQGLVDAVLSQRADERRGLFEHAAGITALRLKFADAERHLSESQSNSERLEDLLSEIAPRLRSLERAARQAREFDQLRARLTEALAQYYGRLLRQTQASLTAAEEALQAGQAGMAGSREQRAQARRALEGAEEQTAQLRQETDEVERLLQRLRDECQQLDHTIALLAERRKALDGRRDDLSRRLESVAGSLSGLEAEYGANARALAEIDSLIARKSNQIEELDNASRAARAGQENIEAALRGCERQATEIDRARVKATARLAMLEQQAEDQMRGAEQIATDSASRESQIATVSEELRLAVEAQRAAGQELDALANERRELDQQLKDAGAEQARLEHEVSRIERRAIEVTTRLETLQRLKESGAGLHAGVRAVLEGSRSGSLSGVIGTLSALLKVPAEYEAAIETALGGHLQDIVIERWADAERAIEYLKRTQSGRATFQPLDTIRSRGHSRNPAQTSGIRGVAVDLIDFDPRVEPVLAGLLGRMLVAEDLIASRAVLSTLPGGWSVVTLGGEITRSAGTVTGGARVRESGALARERELRDLPRQRAQLDGEREHLQSALVDAQQRAGQLQQQLADLDHRSADAREAQRRLSSEIERAERWLADLKSAAIRSEDQLAEIEDKQRLNREEQAELLRCIGEADQRLAAVEQERERLRDQLDDKPISQAERALQQAQGELGTLVERQRNLTAQSKRIERQRAGLEAEREQIRADLSSVEQEASALEAERAEATPRLTAVQQELRQAESQRGPIRERLGQAIQSERSLRQALSQAEERVRDEEREHDRLSLAHARRHDEQTLVLERAARELDIADPLVFLQGIALDDAQDDATLERDIGRLRERLRRIGLVGDDAIEQYEREAERHAFLRRQLDDVHSASESLRALMADLGRTMATEFDKTFGEVACAFEATFRAIFGGGQARLVRTHEEGSPAGVDIIAQPPGKRLQSLALLSGGERALTAVALLFAILKVNPSPFCLLDEVDAALDESNVVRVRDELRLLARETQFVVVTHNRATIEGADTLYGVTMGDDGISRVLSLRLPSEASV